MTAGAVDVAPLRAELDRIETRRLSAEVQAQAASAALQARDWTTLNASLGDEALAELQRQREKLERDLGQAEPASSQAVDLQAELAKLDAQQGDRADAALGVLRGQVGALDSQTKDARALLRTKLLGGEISSDILSEIYGLQQEAAIARTQYQTLLSRVRDLEISHGKKQFKVVLTG